MLTATAKSLQLCPTLCDPIDGSPPGSCIPGILQARILEWVAISFSNAWKWKVKVKLLSHVRLLPTPWTAAYQALPSLGFSRQEYWSGVPLPSPTFSISYLIRLAEEMHSIVEKLSLQLNAECLLDEVFREITIVLLPSNTNLLHESLGYRGAKWTNVSCAELYFSFTMDKSIEVAEFAVF